MENKLQQLTEKLYNEGLSKGRAEGEQLIADARREAEELVAQARKKAETIVADAKSEAVQLRENTENEVRLAAGQMQSALRQQIEKVVLLQTITPQISQAWKDGSFMKELVLAAVSQLGGQGLQVVLPENKAAELVTAVKQAVAEKFGTGVEVITDSRVKVPFRIAPREGGYYVSFADADFEALFTSYLRTKVAELLFGRLEEK